MTICSHRSWPFVSAIHNVCQSSKNKCFKTMLKRKRQGEAQPLSYIQCNQYLLFIWPDGTVVVHEVRQVVRDEVFARHAQVNRIPVLELAPQPVESCARNVRARQLGVAEEDVVPHLRRQLLRPVVIQFMTNEPWKSKPFTVGARIPKYVMDRFQGFCLVSRPNSIPVCCICGDEF